MGLTKPRAAQIYNLDYKQATRAVTVANITLAGGAPSVVDGVSLSLNDRVLVTAQSTGSQNGLYLVTTVGSGSNGTWARTTDANATGEIDAGMIVMVTEGTTYADTQWKLITDNPITIDTTALTFTQNYSANSITGGTSNVTVYSNANVTISSAGTPNVLTVSSTGIVVAGTTSVTGNITGANLTTAGQVSATANITGNYFLGNVFYANGITASKIYNGTSEANVGTSGGNANISIGGTSNVVVFATTGEYVTGLLSVTGNITGGNISATNLTGTNVSVTGTVTAASTVGGVITGSSSSVSGTVTAASTVGGVITGSSASVTGTVTATSTVGGVITGSSASVTGNITGGNITIAGSANISTFIGNTFFGTVPAQPTYYNIAPLNLNNSLAAATKVQLNLINTGGGAGAGSAIDFYTYQISVAAANAESRIAAIDDGNYSAYLSLQTKTPGSTGTNTLVERVKIDSTGVSVVANITGGNILTAGQVSTVGNLYLGTGNAGYVYGNGTYLTGISAAISVSKIENGNSNVWVQTAGGDVTVTAGGVSNVAVFSTGSMTLQGAFGTPKTITSNIIVAGGINAMLIGPMVFGNGYNLTVPTSSTVYIYAP